MNFMKVVREQYELKRVVNYAQVAFDIYSHKLYPVRIK